MSSWRDSEEDNLISQTISTPPLARYGLKTGDNSFAPNAKTAVRGLKPTALSSASPKVAIVPGSTLSTNRLNGINAATSSSMSRSSLMSSISANRSMHTNTLSSGNVSRPVSVSRGEQKVSIEAKSAVDTSQPRSSRGGLKGDTLLSLSSQTRAPQQSDSYLRLNPFQDPSCTSSFKTSNKNVPRQSNRPVEPSSASATVLHPKSGPEVGRGRSQQKRKETEQVTVDLLGDSDNENDPQANAGTTNIISERIPLLSVQFGLLKCDTTSAFECSVTMLGRFMNEGWRINWRRRDEMVTEVLALHQIAFLLSNDSNDASFLAIELVNSAKLQNIPVGERCILDPGAKESVQKYIILKMSQDNFHRLKKNMPKSLLDRFNHRRGAIWRTCEAHVFDKMEDLYPRMERELSNILTRAERTSRIESNRRASAMMKYDDPNDSITYLVYPIEPEAQDAITISNGDMKRLAPGVYFNDNLIDLKIKHLLTKLQSEQPELRNRIYAFSCLFFAKLTETTKAAQAHQLVAKWTKHVNLFEMDYILFPINMHNHWSLMVLARPGLLVNWETVRAKEIESKGDQEMDEIFNKVPTGAMEAGDMDNEELKQALAASLQTATVENRPCFLHLDSLSMHPTNKIFHILASYIWYERERRLRAQPAPGSAPSTSKATDVKATVATHAEAKEDADAPSTRPPSTEMDVDPEDKEITANVNPQAVTPDTDAMDVEGEDKIAVTPPLVTDKDGNVMEESQPASDDLVDTPTPSQQPPRSSSRVSSNAKRRLANANTPASVSSSAQKAKKIMKEKDQETLALEAFLKSLPPAVKCAVPQQHNGYDCGVFVIRFAEMVMNKQPTTTECDIQEKFRSQFMKEFSQKDIDLERGKLRELLEELQPLWKREREEWRKKCAAEKREAEAAEGGEGGSENDASGALQEEEQDDEPQIVGMTNEHGLQKGKLPLGAEQDDTECLVVGDTLKTPRELQEGHRRGRSAGKVLEAYTAAPPTQTRKSSSSSSVDVPNTQKRQSSTNAELSMTETSGASDIYNYLANYQDEDGSILAEEDEEQREKSKVNHQSSSSSNKANRVVGESTDHLDRDAAKAIAHARAAEEVSLVTIDSTLAEHDELPTTSSRHRYAHANMRLAAMRGSLPTSEETTVTAAGRIRSTSDLTNHVNAALESANSVLERSRASPAKSQANALFDMYVARPVSSLANAFGFGRKSASNTPAKSTVTTPPSMPPSSTTARPMTTPIVNKKTGHLLGSISDESGEEEPPVGSTVDRQLQQQKMLPDALTLTTDSSVDMIFEDEVAISAVSNPTISSILQEEKDVEKRKRRRSIDEKTADEAVEHDERIETPPIAKSDKKAKKHKREGKAKKDRDQVHDDDEDNGNDDDNERLVDVLAPQLAHLPSSLPSQQHPNGTIPQTATSLVHASTRTTNVSAPASSSSVSPAIQKLDASVVIDLNDSSSEEEKPSDKPSTSKNTSKDINGEDKDRHDHANSSSGYKKRKNSAAENRNAPEAEQTADESHSHSSTKRSRT